MATANETSARTTRRAASRLVEAADASLLDLIDNALNRGVVIEGELIIGLCDVDLIYLRLSALLVAADRVEPGRRRRVAGGATVVRTLEGDKA